MGTASPGKKADTVEVGQGASNAPRVPPWHCGCEVNEARTAVGEASTQMDCLASVRAHGARPDGGDYQVRRPPSAVSEYTRPRACVPSGREQRGCCGVA